MVVRQYNEELKYLEKINPHCWRIKKGFQPNMNVEGVFYVNNHLEKLMLDELRNSCRPGMVGGFLPGVKQIANVAALPGIVGRSVGNMAAFDMDNPKSVVSPGGVGFDINCGVRLLRTNLHEKDVLPVKGSTRAFPPHHPLIPVDYQLTGQPVLIGGTMGTCSYVLTGTEQGMQETFGSTCHGAVSTFTMLISN
ncbi:tRNA-splicing ligase RtcB [Blattella germanica]|nr:tRNA-splicing ligase RtcB [Blattella germanica]